MRHKLYIILLASMIGFSSVAYAAQMSSAPDKSLFNKDAGPAPTYIFWAHKAWKCATYDDKGQDCLKVEELNNPYMAATTPVAEDEVVPESEMPCTCVFDRTRMWVPETFPWKNRTWKCAEYDVDEIYCVKIVVVKE